MARVIGGRPLQYFLLLSAGLSNVGLFEAEMCSDSYQIYGMAERGLLPAVCATRSKHGTPTVGILMSAAGVLFVSLNGIDPQRSVLPPPPPPPPVSSHGLVQTWRPRVPALLGIFSGTIVFAFPIQ